MTSPGCGKYLSSYVQPHPVIPRRGVGGGVNSSCSQTKVPRLGRHLDGSGCQMGGRAGCGGRGYHTHLLTLFTTLVPSLVQGGDAGGRDAQGRVKVVGIKLSIAVCHQQMWGTQERLTLNLLCRGQEHLLSVSSDEKCGLNKPLVTATTASQSLTQK